MFIFSMSFFLSYQRNATIDFLCGCVCLSSVPRHHFVVSGCILCEGFEPTAVVLDIAFEMYFEYVDQRLYCM